MSNTPQSSSTHPFGPGFHDQNLPATYSHSTGTSSPELPSVGLNGPIPEQEDETSSETANEPPTPTNPHTMEGKTYGKRHSIHIFDAFHAHRFFNDTSKDGSVKRAVSGLFKRSSSQAHFPLQPLTRRDQSVNGSHPISRKEGRRRSTPRVSATNSSHTTRSNTPPSPGTPAEGEEHLRLQIQEPSSDESINSRKRLRSSTGLSIRDRFHRHKLTFGPPRNEPKHGHHRPRSTSVDLDMVPRDEINSRNPDLQQISRQVWGMPAETGIGLKSRRLSLSLPDDFTVDVVELYSEYTDRIKLLGRHGKSIGKGATANVRLMQRKGSGELYAVKEFRGKSSNESAENYEKKVKSEYSIAKSVHHPNIVETFRLCTHSGRWNHVMEFCDQGDLFSLVNQKYLATDAHRVDRLCLFKQLIQGLNYLHNHGIAHRDVKLENLLVTRDSKLKITDFGVSEVFSGIHPCLRAAGGQCGKEMGEVRLCAPGICGSPPYIAPEVIAKRGEYDPRPLDVWGAAIVMLCMCANGCLWDKAVAGSSPLYDDLVNGWAKWNTTHSDAPEITESDYPHVNFFDSHIKPPALRRLLLTMLNPDPTERVTMAAVANNRWLKHVECCQVDGYDDPTVLIDASKSRSCTNKLPKVVHHNHLPPHTRLGRKLARLPGNNSD